MLKIAAIVCKKLFDLTVEAVPKSKHVCKLKVDDLQSYVKLVKGLEKINTDVRR